MNYLAIAIAVIVGGSFGTARINAGDDQKKIEKEMIAEAKKAAERPQGNSNYEIKKSHDPGEHFPATEKAAADATKKDKPNK